LFTSVTVAVLATFISLLFALPVSYYLAIHVSDSIRNILLFLVIAPLWINFYVRAFAIIQITGTRGILNQLLTSIGLIEEPYRGLIYSEPSVVLGLVYVWLPLMILPIYASLRHLNPEWLSAARDLGAGTLRTHYEVTLPVALPGIILGTLFVFLLSFGNRAVAEMIGGAKTVPYTQTIVNQMQGGNWPTAAAGSVVMMLFVIVVLLGVFSVFDMEELF
jgi:ABC-type spermidine/putrescine transport system permease subunit I